MTLLNLAASKQDIDEGVSIALNQADDSQAALSTNMSTGLGGATFGTNGALSLGTKEQSNDNVEEKKELPSMFKQSSTTSNGSSGIALFGKNKLSLGFYNLNSDFELPDEFNLVKKLGKGAYGRVMQILHMQSQREYACKRYEHVFSDTQRARRLLREMNILKKMDHPCCNRLLCVIPPGNVIKDKTTPIADLKFNEVYLVLRKCDMDLKKLIKSGRHLEETQVKSIVYDILCGLKYLHQAKIIHRDLKPGNILVNNDCTIQICDFGLARSMDGVSWQEAPAEEQV